MKDIKKYILIILKLTTIFNAIILGWTVNISGEKKIILRKKIKNMTNLDKNTTKLIQLLTEM